ncbi:UNVERIFIED_CONTAM: hypothetical protein PYX00_003469 [Menopon gallinae]|uniref:Uncharacterized protein n=1 Tax=Menopon gallinae TaxID=328185 RepID=A0AAW2I054_9NEOP
MKGILLNFILCLYLSTCRCQSHGISTREAKSFFESRPNSYLMTNEFAPLYIKKENFKNEKTGTEKRREMENNQISWTAGESPATSTEGKTLQPGETDKIITVRVSSSVVWKPSYPDPKMSGFGYRHFSQPIWEQQTTEAPESRYYETRIEAVSSRLGVVFGKPKTVTTTTPQYDYYPEPREEFCEMPETNYELPEKNYELPEKSYELPEKSFEVDEAVSLITNGNVDVDRALPEEKGKLGYVMEGRNFRKYRVEERTADGFIVGEFGFIRNDDGKLQGVRYTADVNANPRLIYDALVKFLSL